MKTTQQVWAAMAEFLPDWEAAFVAGDWSACWEFKKRYDALWAEWDGVSP